MPQTILEKDKLFAELDKLTEFEIEARLKAGIWHPEDKRKLVELYLRGKELERTEEVQAEQTAIARSAKNAAWIAALAAVVAAVAALLAFLR